jgi:hypothetical protein
VSSVTADPTAVRAPNHPAGGLDVVFHGVEVYEVRARGTVGWRRTLACASLAALIVLSITAWTPGNRSAANLHLRNGSIITGLTALYALWILRRTAIVWRFDHKRKTITRRHWLRGMSRRWDARKLATVALLNHHDRLSGPVIQLGMLDAQGKLVARLGRWDLRQVDLTQLQTIVGEIKKVMWWK